ncbi:MAG TPA: lysophospholipid acyltransferase family protein [Methylomirabilota bacterium]|nr:lysophospholipid acyltransferase family protein [Methylomirabilota bacterium]
MAGDTVAPPRWYSHGLNRLVYYRMAGGAAGLLPRRSRLRVARLAGRIAARGLTEERARVRGNLARILPGAGRRALERAVAETFANFAACFSDFLTINRGAPERLGEYMGDRRGEEHLDAACVAGRGVILLTAHLGNWELGGRLLVPRLDRPTHIVLAGEQDADLERYLRRAGERLRFVTRRHATSTLGLLAALRRNEAVAMQGDRPTGERDLLVEFFGAPAAFPVGPFVLARATGAPVVPAYCAMTHDRRYEMVVEPAIWVKPGEEAAALAAMVATLERAIRAHPTQWFNFFDVWSPPRAA